MLKRKRGLAVLASGFVSPIETGVQGVGVRHGIDAITLKGRSWRAAVGDAVMDAKIERTIEGASTLTIDVHDRHGKLLANPILRDTYDLELDGLGFTSVKVHRQDPTTIELTHEDREVALMRLRKGARKAMPGKNTLAQFAYMLVREIQPPLPFYSPELLHPKPITSAKAQRAAEPQQRATRAPGGLTTKSGVTVKHAPASAAQINILNQGLDTAQSMHANQRVMIALVMTGTQESDVSILHGQGGYGWLSQLKNGAWPASGDVPRDSRAFLQHAIANDKKSPHQSLAALCQSVQASANGSLYAAWENEATHTVQTYLGAAGSANAAADTGSRSQAFALERHADEDTWDCLKRLTDDVGWRCFESAGITYVFAEPDLFASAPRMMLSDASPGIDAITFQEDDGKVVSEAQVTARAGAWQAPPGTIVDLADSLGPAAGRFIVNTIGSQVREVPVDVTIDLKRPQEPHAPTSASSTGGGKSKTKLKSGGSTSQGAGGAQQMVSWAKTQLGVTEGSARQRQYASALGLSASLPWCSIFIAYGLKQVTNLPMPSNPAYSGAWESWSGGTKVGKTNPQPGDLLIYDWGDGGQTDHVALYIGHGQRIGGNQSNRVSQEAAMLSACVAVVRPHY